jgi:hypothetical protein
MIPKSTALYRNLALGLTTALITLVIGAVVILFVARNGDGEESVEVSAVLPVLGRSSQVPAPAEPKPESSRTLDGKVAVRPASAEGSAAVADTPGEEPPSASPQEMGPPDTLRSEGEGSVSGDTAGTEEIQEEARLQCKELMELGDAAFANGEFGRAFRLYQRAVTLDGTQSRAWYGLGRAAHEKGNAKKAVTAIRKSLRLSPGRYKRRLYLGKVYMSWGRRERAIREWERVYKASPAGRAEAERLLKEAGVDVEKI